MEYYQKLQDIEKLHEHATIIGRSFHVMRNYLQGYVENEFPELATLDNRAGTMEGVIRAIKAKLINQQDIKKDIQTIIYNSKFMLKIMDPNFIGNKKFDQQILGKLKALTELTEQSAVFIDVKITNAILELTQESTGVPINMIQIPPIDQKKEENINKCFDSSQFAEKTQQQIPQTLDQQKEICYKLGQFMSNKAHFCQDQVSEYQQTPGMDKAAQSIINLAGQIENNSRNIIKIVVQNPNKIAKQGLQQQKNQINENLKKLREQIEKPEFEIVQKKSNLQKIYGEFDPLIKILNGIVV